MAVIEVKNFSKRFGEKIVHRDINFSVNEGECLGLIGGSGAGKSVILRSLIGLEKPDRGQILIENEDITGKSESELVPVRKKVAYVFQNGALFDSMSVYENLAYPLREHTGLNDKQIKSCVIDALEDFGLSGNENVYPSQLSGGMQKRVGLARSTILNPQVVLYDEPTAGLDPFNTIKIQEMILRLKERGATSIFVTHDMPSALAVCDRIALVQKGSVTGIEDIQTIKSSKNSLINRFVRGEFS